MVVVLAADTPLAEVFLVGRAIPLAHHIMVVRRALVLVHQDGDWHGLCF